MRRETTAALEFTAILPGGRVLTAEELGKYLPIK
jgi:hypothetical protein